MAGSFVAATEAFSSSSDNAPHAAVPAGVGTVYIFAVLCREDITITWPTGFTERAAAGETSLGTRIRVATRTYTGTESGTFTAAASGFARWFARISLVDGVNPVPVSSSARAAYLGFVSSIPLTGNNVTDSTGDYIFWIGGSESGGGPSVPTPTPPSGFTARDGNYAPGTDGDFISIADFTVVTGGTHAYSGSATAAATSRSGLVGTIAFNPSAPSTTPVSSDIDLRWAIRARITQNSDYRWALRSRRFQPCDVRWRLAARVVGASDMRWRIAARVGASSDWRWTLAARIAAALDIRWQTAGKIVQVLELQWEVESALVSVASDLDLRWSIRAATLAAIDLRWFIRVGVSSNVEAQWSVRERRFNTADLRWSVARRITNSIDSRWAVRRSIFADKTFRWEISLTDEYEFVEPESIAVVAASKIYAASPRPILFARPARVVEFIRIPRG